MSPIDLVLLLIIFFVVALLYSSVGHAGASGYLAIMAWFSFLPETIKSTSLILNIIVASIASYHFIRNKLFDKKLFFMLILTSIPMSFIGGSMQVEKRIFSLLVGAFLILSSILLFYKKNITSNKVDSLNKASFLSVLIVGSSIGFISGLIGVGGGIFLTPILLLTKWVETRKASGISAAFILCNSLSGLAGSLLYIKQIDSHIPWWIMAVLTGGWLGAKMGSEKLSSRTIYSIIMCILFVSGIKFIITNL